eukprot:767720-Hanusia_phi.AAC.5
MVEPTRPRRPRRPRRDGRDGRDGTGWLQPEPHGAGHEDDAEPSDTKLDNHDAVKSEDDASIVRRGHAERQSALPALQSGVPDGHAAGRSSSRVWSALTLQADDAGPRDDPRDAGPRDHEPDDVDDGLRRRSSGPGGTGRRTRRTRRARRRARRARRPCHSTHTASSHLQQPPSSAFHHHPSSTSRISTLARHSFALLQDGLALTRASRGRHDHGRERRERGGDASGGPAALDGGGELQQAVGVEAVGVADGASGTRATCDVKSADKPARLLSGRASRNTEGLSVCVTRQVNYEPSKMNNMGRLTLRGDCVPFNPCAPSVP